MARYIDPVCRLCRREGLKLYLKGGRCYSKKCSFEKRPTPPGQHGVRRRKVGDYGLQLREKRVEIALTYIYGVGLSSSQKILKQTSINPDTRVRDLTEDQVNRLREVIDRTYKVEGDLRREVALNIKRLIEIGSYRGLRHRRNLPVRGQRTKTNARQRRGPKKTVGARKKK